MRHVKALLCFVMAKQSSMRGNSTSFSNRIFPGSRSKFVDLGLISKPVKKLEMVWGMGALPSASCQQKKTFELIWRGLQLGFWQGLRRRCKRGRGSCWGAEPLREESISIIRKGVMFI